MIHLLHKNLTIKFGNMRELMKRTILKQILIVITVFSPTYALAIDIDIDNITPITVTNAEDSKLEAKLGIETYYENYRQLLVPNSLVIKQEGGLGSLILDLTYALPENFKLLLSGRYFRGKAKYTTEGKRSNYNYANLVAKNKPRDGMDLRFLLGYQLPSLNYPTKLFLGVGYRRLREFEVKKLKAYRINSLPYIHLSTETVFSLGNFEVVPRIGYSVPIGAQQIESYNQYNQVVKLPLGHGFETDLLFSYKAKIFKISLGPFFSFLANA